MRWGCKHLSIQCCCFLIVFFLNLASKGIIKAVGVSGNSYDQTTTMLKLPEMSCWLPSDLCAYPKLFTLPAEIPNQPNCAKTRCHMQRSVFVYKGVIELFYKQLDVKTQYVCTEREQCRCIWVDVKMRMYIRTPYLSVSVICISLFFLIFIQVILGEYMIKFFLLHQSHHKW